MQSHLRIIYIFLFVQPYLWAAPSVFKDTLGGKISDYELGNNYLGFSIMAMNINSLSKGNLKFIIPIVWITR